MLAMRVVFLEDVEGVAHGGDIKEVKNGFARNYLIPQSLAVPATHNALQRIVGLKKQAEVTRLKTLSDMRELAESMNGFQVNIEMRAGANGRLYGSVTNAMIADELSSLTDRDIDRRTVEIDDAIRQLGKYEVTVRLHPDVSATVNVLVYPTGTDPNAMEETEADVEEGAEEPVAEAEEAAAPVAQEESTDSDDASDSDDGEEDKE
jgi:large subunit ribosomal protein L9